jgi:hypothetical protein
MLHAERGRDLGGARRASLRGDVEGEHPSAHSDHNTNEVQ